MRRRLPTAFETFYGFIGGENNQYYPALYDGTSPVEPEKTPEEGYHLTEDLADRAIDWVKTQKALAPGKPFFAYFAPGATHAPHHVPLEWADEYKGQFADGWDALRESIFERQQKLGVVDAGAELTPRPDEIPAWADMDDELKLVLERQMEVYAGFLAHTDHHVGRLLDAVEEIGALDNTLVYYIVGDNGASAEGTINGAFNEMANFNGESAIETPEFMASVKDKLGTPDAYNHYAVGWAWAMCSPYQWTKQVASDWGGTRNGTIVHWPDGFKSKGEIRTQFSHVIDVAPTILEATGLPEPTFVNGVQQAPIEARAWSTATITPTRPSATTSSTSRCSETAASTTRGGAPSRATVPRGCRPRSCPRSTMTSGSSTTAKTTGRRPTTWQPRIPNASHRSSVSG
jgi:arylsulfatase A-like enzyme